MGASAYRRQFTGFGPELKLHRAVTGVGWALLPVGVLDGQCPSYSEQANFEGKPPGPSLLEPERVEIRILHYES